MRKKGWRSFRKRRFKVTIPILSAELLWNMIFKPATKSIMIIWHHLYPDKRGLAVFDNYFGFTWSSRNWLVIVSPYIPSRWYYQHGRWLWVKLNKNWFSTRTEGYNMQVKRSEPYWKKNTLIKQSMSRKADCWDNAIAENFFRTLKVELIYRERFETIEHAKDDVFEYIEI